MSKICKEDILNQIEKYLLSLKKLNYTEYLMFQSEVKKPLHPLDTITNSTYVEKFYTKFTFHTCYGWRVQSPTYRIVKTRDHFGTVILEKDLRDKNHIKELSNAFYESLEEMAKLNFVLMNIQNKQMVEIYENIKLINNSNN